MQHELAPRSDEHALNVGEYPWCWPAGATTASVTLLKRASPDGAAADGFTDVTGDGYTLPFRDRKLDVVFPTASSSTWAPGSGNRP